MQKKFIFFLVICLAIAVTACNNSAEKSEEADTVTTRVPDSITVPVSLDTATIQPSADKGLDVSAYLVYENGSLSSFDVLNDKTKALWNVIIGAGDAEQPSEKTKLVIRGSADSIDLLVRDGGRAVVNKKNLLIKDSAIYFLENTGCQEITVQVKRKTKMIYRERIEFHCGE